VVFFPPSAPCSKLVSLPSMEFFLTLAAFVFLSGQGGPAAAAERLGPGLKTDKRCNLESGLNETLQHIISTNAVVLFGWSHCPCTGIAHDRLVSRSACFAGTVYHSQHDPTFKYLQCVYGEEHHSFLFFGGKFKGNGFVLRPEATNETTLAEWLDEAGAQTDCTVEGQKSLTGGPLQPCSNPDEVPTGWTRHGTCEWQIEDAGYHQVCVKMSSKFLKNSANKDRNDLNSVVQENGHWCICAWAFASAVHRDSKALEGLELDCNRTNLKLVDVYRKFERRGEEMRGPGQYSYPVGPALRKVFELCPHAHYAASQRQMQANID